MGADTERGSARFSSVAIGFSESPVVAIHRASVVRVQHLRSFLFAKLGRGLEQPQALFPVPWERFQAVGVDAGFPQEKGGVEIHGARMTRLCQLLEQLQCLLRVLA